LLNDLIKLENRLIDLLRSASLPASAPPRWMR
jgi:hypothetical protein